MGEKPAKPELRGAPEPEYISREDLTDLQLARAEAEKGQMLLAWEQQRLIRRYQFPAGTSVRPTDGLVTRPPVETPEDPL